MWQHYFPAPAHGYLAAVAMADPPFVSMAARTKRVLDPEQVRRCHWLHAPGPEQTTRSGPLVMAEAAKGSVILDQRRRLLEGTHCQWTVMRVEEEEEDV